MFGIDVGPSSQENQNYNALFGSSAFATGQRRVRRNFLGRLPHAILSGNNAQIMQLLAPQINGIKTSAQNLKLKNSQFSNRSGGVVASNNAIDDSTRSDISRMVGNLTGTAASSLGSREKDSSGWA